jgi:hypothetical protein
MSDALPTLASSIWPISLQMALVAVVGMLVGAASMLVYWWLSPQSLLAEVSARAAEARLDLQRFDGTDVGVVWSMTKRALRLSIRQIALAILPTAAAIIPVIALAWLMDDWFDPPGGPGSPIGPAWLAPGHAAFWTSLCVSALLVKLRFKIK